MQSCSFYPLHITCMKCRYCYSAKIYGRVIIFQSIAPPTKYSRAYRQVTLHLKMAMHLVFACRLTEKPYHCTFVCMSIIK